MSIRPHGLSLCLALLASAGAPAMLTAQSDGDHTYTSDAIEIGSRLYVAECAICHGPNGDEVDGTNLRTGAFRNVRSDDDIRAIVTEGVGGRRMPAFDLREEELDGKSADPAQTVNNRQRGQKKAAKSDDEKRREVRDSLLELLAPGSKLAKAIMDGTRPPRPPPTASATELQAATWLDAGYDKWVAFASISLGTQASYIEILQEWDEWAEAK